MNRSGKEGQPKGLSVFGAASVGEFEMKDNGSLAFRGGHHSSDAVLGQKRGEAISGLRRRPKGQTGQNWR